MWRTVAAVTSEYQTALSEDLNRRNSTECTKRTAAAKTDQLNRRKVSIQQQFLILNKQQRRNKQLPGEMECNEETQIVLNLCETLVVFEKDTDDTQLAPELPNSLFITYMNFCKSIGLEQTEQNLIVIRQCVFRLRNQPDLLRKWQAVRRFINTPEQKSVTQRQTRRGHVFLVPPIKKCMNPNCQSDLTLHAVSDGLRLLTEDGLKSATELSYKCKRRSCRNSNTFHYDHYKDTGLGVVHYSGSAANFEGDQYRPVYSQHLQSIVSVPVYIRVSRQVWMSWRLLEHISALMAGGGVSYSRVNKQLHKTLYQRNLIDGADLRYCLQIMQSSKDLSVYHSWFRMLRVC